MSDVEKCKNGHEYPKNFELECSKCRELKITKIFHNDLKI